jgi:S-DNA-T family DNA segregation ATPase FtsK/SpoIIIE
MSYKTGIHLGGYINSQKLFQFTNIPFAQQSKPMKTGLGLIPSAEDSAAAQQVVIPLAKGK